MSVMSDGKEIKSVQDIITAFGSEASLGNADIISYIREVESLCSSSPAYRLATSAADRVQESSAMESLRDRLLTILYETATDEDNAEDTPDEFKETVDKRLMEESTSIVADLSYQANKLTIIAKFLQDNDLYNEHSSDLDTMATSLYEQEAKLLNAGKLYEAMLDINDPDLTQAEYDVEIKRIKTEFGIDEGESLTMASVTDSFKKAMTSASRQQYLVQKVLDSSGLNYDAILAEKIESSRKRTGYQAKFYKCHKDDDDDAVIYVESSKSQDELEEELREKGITVVEEVTSFSGLPDFRYASGVVRIGTEEPDIYPSGITAADIDMLKGDLEVNPENIQWLKDAIDTIIEDFKGLYPIGSARKIISCNNGMGMEKDSRNDLLCQEARDILASLESESEALRSPKDSIKQVARIVSGLCSDYAILKQRDSILNGLDAGISNLNKKSWGIDLHSAVRGHQAEVTHAYADSVVEAGPPVTFSARASLPEADPATPGASTPGSSRQRAR